MSLEDPQKIPQASQMARLELYCPECMGALELTDGSTARCQIHGGSYSVLFLQWRPVAHALAVEFRLAPGAVCAAHPNVLALVVCQHCGKSLCATCEFPSWGNRKVCLDCVPLDRPPPNVDPTQIESVPTGTFCVQHPKVAAVQKCRTCGAFTCATCDFAFPGNIHLCPVCATRSQSAVTPKRKKYVIWSLVLSGFATLVLGAVISGVFGRPRTAEDQSMVGIAMMAFVLAPSIAGFSMGIAAKPRQGATPLNWIAIVWPAMLVGCFVLLGIVGAMK